MHRIGDLAFNEYYGCLGYIKSQEKEPGTGKDLFIIEWFHNNGSSWLCDSTRVQETKDKLQRFLKNG